MAYNNNIPSYHDLRALSIVWLRAIALAWEYQLLLIGLGIFDQYGNLKNKPSSDSPPEVFKALRFLNLLSVDVQQALREYFNYQCPFSVNLKATPLEAPGSVTWNPTTVDGSSVTPGDWDWTRLRPNQITFHLPSNPICRWAPTGTGSPQQSDESIANQRLRILKNSQWPLPQSLMDDLMMGDEAIALAAYLDSGSSYLFSCC